MSQFGGGGGTVPTPWYKENPFWGGIGGFFTFALTGVGFGVSGHLTLGMWLLAAALPWGVMAMWLAVNGLTDKRSIRIRRKVVAIASLVLIVALSALWMDKANTAVKPTDQPSAQGKPTGPQSPSVDLLYDPSRKAFDFLNHGQTNVYFWGDKLDDGPKSLDKPRVITPTGSYHVWADKVAEEIIRKLGPDRETRIPFEVYMSTEDQTKYVITYELWIKTKDGVVSIETQNLGAVTKDFGTP